jgi:hypothetical protein
MWQDVARCGKMWQDMMWKDVARCAKNPQYAFHYIPNFVHIVYMLAVMSAG